MRLLRQMLSKALGRDEVVRAARAQIVLRQWEQVVGAQLAQRSSPDRYDRGTVWISVQGSAWAQELRMSKDTILGRLRELGQDPSLFIDLRFGVRPIERETAQEDVEAETFDESGRSAEKRALSISEIAERRLKNWKDG